MFLFLFVLVHNLNLEIGLCLFSFKVENHVVLDVFMSMTGFSFPYSFSRLLNLAHSSRVKTRVSQAHWNGQGVAQSSG
jgi:hypothetical protein